MHSPEEVPKDESPEQNVLRRSKPLLLKQSRPHKARGGRRVDRRVNQANAGLKRLAQAGSVAALERAGVPVLSRRNVVQIRAVGNLETAAPLQVVQVVVRKAPSAVLARPGRVARMTQETATIAALILVPLQTVIPNVGAMQEEAVAGIRELKREEPTTGIKTEHVALCNAAPGRERTRETQVMHNEKMHVPITIHVETVLEIRAMRGNEATIAGEAPLPEGRQIVVHEALVMIPAANPRVVGQLTAVRYELMVVETVREGMQRG